MNTIIDVLAKVQRPHQIPTLIDYSDRMAQSMKEKVKDYIADVDSKTINKRKPKVASKLIVKRKRPQLSDAVKAEMAIIEMAERIDIDSEDLLSFIEDSADDGSDFSSYINVIDKIIEALKKNKKSITFGYYSFYGGNGSAIGLALDDIGRNIDLIEKNRSYYEDNDGKKKIKSLLKKYFPMNDYSEDGPYVIPNSFKETTIIFDNLTKEKKELYIKKLSKIKELQEKENTES